ncbi:hypothetical protein KA093_01580 [Candidatus Saccharibacteria bacterium]|nr:hypothetical protein [Candidatus Saccharibacteria bacterium]
MTRAIYDGLTLADLEEAFLVAQGAFTAARDVGALNRYAGTLVTLDPFSKPSSTMPEDVGLDEVLEAVVFIRRIDDSYVGTGTDGAPLGFRDFDEFALTKARDLWVARAWLGPNFTSLDLRRHPHLYTAGMTHYVGGVCHAGRVTSFSGVQGDNDLAVALTFDAWLEARARLRATSMFDRTMNPSGFVGGDVTRDRMFVTGAFDRLDELVEACTGPEV